MANVNINFNGKDFLLSCEDGQEEHLDELSKILNNKFNKLKATLGNIGENKLLLITSITVLDEYYETKKRINEKKIEIDEIKNKFKELKSLVYEFKKNKDIQIHLLNEKQKELEIEIEKNKNNYNSIIEDTTNKLENFIKKIDVNSSLDK